MSTKTRTSAIAIIVLVSLIAMAYVWLNYGVKPATNAVPASKTASTSNRVLLDGNVVADRSADLGFVLPSTITSITKKVGDVIKAGDVLAIENSSDIKAQVAAAKAGAQSSQAMLDGLNSSLKMQKLKLKGLDGNDKKIQKAQISGARDSISAQENAVAAAQDSITNAQAQLAKTVLIAPFDGIITRQDGEVGEVSGPTVAPFLTIESKGPFQKIESYASDLDVTKIKVGDSAKVTLDSSIGGQSIAAHVTSIDPAAKDGKATYKVTLLLDEPNDNILSGMHVGISLGQ